MPTLVLNRIFIESKQNIPIAMARIYLNDTLNLNGIFVYTFNVKPPLF